MILLYTRMEQMKMKNYGLIFGFMAVLLGFLLGITVYAEDETPALEKQNSNGLSKQIPPKTKTSKSKKSKAKSTVTKQETKAKSGQTESTDGDIQDEDELQKPLDLSIPFQSVEDVGLKNEQSQTAQSRVPNLFAAENKKKQRPLKLDGGVLMSQEPEAEKQRSLDGAGIRLNVNP